MFIIFFVSALAETNRPPFDLTEAESELVAGYQVEYSASLFLLQFLTELVAILLMSSMTAILFLGGWLSPLPFPPFTWVPGLIWFLIKAWSVVFCFSMVKAFVPRYRYDQLMRLGWKVFLPISLFMVVLVAAVLEFTGLRRPRFGLREEERTMALRLAQSARSLFLAEFFAALRAVDPLHVQAEGDAELSAREVAAVARASAASMRSGAIPTARSAASPASCARRSARRRRSPSRRARAATTARGGPPATTST